MTAEDTLILPTAGNGQPSPKGSGSSFHLVPFLLGLGRRLLVAGLCALALVTIWSGAVLWRGGQVVDTAAMFRAVGWAEFFEGAQRVFLATFTFPVVGFLVLVGVVAALLQRKWATFFAQIMIFAGPTLLTQFLKHEVLWRPELGVSFRLDNSLPSGHTTAAVAAAIVLVLGMPRRLRALGVWVGLVWSLLIGLGTLWAGWHRPADVVAAFLVVAFFVALFTPREYFRGSWFSNTVSGALTGKLFVLVSRVFLGISIPVLVVLAIVFDYKDTYIAAMDPKDFLAFLDPAFQVAAVFSAIASMVLIVGVALRLFGEVTGTRR